MADLYFRCGDCGKRLMEFDGKTYRAPERKKTVPIRAGIEQRKKEAGRALCDACWRKFKRERRKNA